MTVSAGQPQTYPLFGVGGSVTWKIVVELCIVSRHFAVPTARSVR